MIKSLTFTGESGYIVDKIEEPVCPVRGYTEGMKNPRYVSETDKEQIKQWKKEHKEWEKHKDDYAKPHLVKNLLGRKFEFEAGKINVIFGANASGKTTILRAIAGNAGCDDGYPTLMAPLDVHDFGEEASTDSFKKKLTKKMRNSANIEWDGVPVYYDNFANRKSYGSIGDLCGSVLGDDIMTEIQWILGKDKISMGQQSIYLINRLFDIAKSHLSFKDIFSQYVNDDGTRKKMEVNDVWESAYNVQLDYYMGFENSCKNLPGTFLFDELDKSLDILNVYNLYVNVLPEFVKKTGVQIIIISHSPIVLLEKIRNNEMYNIISIDEDYTKECIKLLEK
jgi:predicted ATPase